MISFLCEGVWLTFSSGDQLAQIAFDEHAPGVRAATVAFVFRYETYVRETNLRFALFFRDIKINVRAIPLRARRN